MGVFNKVIGLVFSASVFVGGLAAADVASTPNCQTIEIPIYFEQNATQLSAQSAAVLAFAASDLQSCDVQGVRFDVPASGDLASMKMIQDRTESVQRMLAELGLEQAMRTLSATQSSPVSSTLAQRQIRVIIGASPTSQS